MNQIASNFRYGIKRRDYRQPILALKIGFVEQLPQLVRRAAQAGERFTPPSKNATSALTFDCRHCGAGAVCHWARRQGYPALSVLPDPRPGLRRETHD